MATWGLAAVSGGMGLGQLWRQVDIVDCKGSALLIRGLAEERSDYNSGSVARFEADTSAYV